MRWSALRAAYPKQWVVVEEREFESDEDRRFGHDWYVLSTHRKAEAALHAYIESVQERPNPDIRLVDTTEFAAIHQAAVCANCGATGLGRDCYWMAHLNWCSDCMHHFIKRRWVKRGRDPFDDNPRSYRLTQLGDEHLPQHKTVACCPNDGMEIYRRWIDEGVATMTACPYCLRDAGRAE